MFKGLAFGLGVGAGVQAWRAWPPLMPVTGDAMAVVFVVGLLSAYLGGRWSSRGGSVATAVASAEAHAQSAASAVQSVNVAVVVPGQGAGSAATGVRVPGESVPWIASPETTPALSVDQLDGYDLDELLEQQEEHDT